MPTKKTVPKQKTAQKARPASRIPTQVKPPKRGEIWIVDFNPTEGDEITKQRPAVVLGTQAIGLNITIIVPLTTWQVAFANVWHIISVQAQRSSGLQVQSGASCYHLRSVSNTRFLRKLGSVSALELDEITACVQNCVEI
jgi:mRNA interferase MazF